MTVHPHQLTFQNGQPKIAVPIVTTTPEAALDYFKQLDIRQFDLVEWRLDALKFPVDLPTIVATAQAIHRDCPLLATIRTSAEGGQWDLQATPYTATYTALLEAEAVDLIDLEAALPTTITTPLQTLAHQHHILTIASYHNFDQTPKLTELHDLLAQLEATGADLIKFAVMPTNSQDVLTVLTAINQYHGQRPLIAMAMGDLGKITRLSGHLFPTALTFATAGVASAPGQLTVTTVQNALKILNGRNWNGWSKPTPPRNWRD